MRVTYSKLKQMKFIKVTNNTGFSVTFCNLGAAIFMMEYCGEVMTRNVKNYIDFMHPKCFYGKTIGRVANRIKGNKITVNGKEYRIETNENGNCLHGGLKGTMKHYYTYRTVVNDGNLRLIFETSSKHLEGGFPGNMKIKVTYVIYENSAALDVFYEAITDRDTPVNFTNHSYFTLGDKNLSTLKLWLNSHYLIETDDELCPIKKVPITKDTDFNHGKLLNVIGDDFKIDSFFFCDHSKEPIILENDRYVLGVFSNFDGAQIYTSHLKEKFPLDGDAPLYNSLAIEPTDNYLYQNILKPGVTYRRYIRYRLRTK